jgi:hypothetical protein
MALTDLVPWGRIVQWLPRGLHKRVARFLLSIEK